MTSSTSINYIARFLSSGSARDTISNIMLCFHWISKFLCRLAELLLSRCCLRLCLHLVLLAYHLLPSKRVNSGLILYFDMDRVVVASAHVCLTGSMIRIALLSRILTLILAIHGVIHHPFAHLSSIERV